MWKQSQVTRRQFLRLSGVTVLSTVIAACVKQPAEPTATQAPAQPTTAPAATAEQPTAAPAATAAPEFQESPVLSDLVKEGKLPPLADRLPVEPMVVERAGKFGGTMRMASTSTALFPYEARYAGALNGTPMRLSEDLTDVIPNVWKGIDVSPDFKTITCYMREGLKWSDGEPHTADDWVFWYEDVILNEELTASPERYFTVGGEVMKLVKLDDYSFRMEFAAPNPSFPMVNLAHTYGFWNDHALPAHYLKEFHIKYNDKADELAQENGFDHWYQYFGTMRNIDQNPEVPILGAYVVEKDTPDAVYYKRNPYYWIVDSEGKQLPYFDAVIVDRVDDAGVIEAKAVAGEYDFVSGFYLQTKNYKTYKDGEEKGNYKVYVWKSGTNAALYSFNMNYPDDAWRNVFSDVRFRRALSVAINREEINEVLFFGMGTPSQLTAHPTSRHYKEEYAQAWVQYDPDLANQLLDEIGLNWDSGRKQRLLPDGRPMQMVLETHTSSPIHEMVFEYWRDVGILADYKTITRTLLRPKVQGNQQMMSTWQGDEIMDVLLLRRPKWFAPIYGDESTWAPMWALWQGSDGEEGEEPPEEIKQLYEWLDKYAETDSNEWADRLLASQAENLWCIGTVVDAPAPLIFGKDTGNVPESAYHVWDNWWGIEQYPEAWFFDR